MGDALRRHHLRSGDEFEIENLGRLSSGVAIDSRVIYDDFQLLTSSIQRQQAGGEQ